MTIEEIEALPIFTQAENEDGSITFHSPCLFVDDIVVPANMIPDVVAIQNEFLQQTNWAKNFAMAFMGGRITNQNIVEAISFLSKMPFYNWFFERWGDLQLVTIENPAMGNVALAVQKLKWENTEKFSFSGTLKTTSALSITTRILQKITFVQLRNAFLMWHHLYDLVQEFGENKIDEWWEAMQDPSYVITPKVKIQLWEEKDSEEEEIFP